MNRKHRIQFWGWSGALLLLLGFGTGCQTNSDAGAEAMAETAPAPANGASEADSAQEEIQKLRKHFEDYKKPETAYPKIRAFARQNFDRLSEAELAALSNDVPELTASFDETLYAFCWSVPGQRKKLQVLTTPAPFTPIAVYRVEQPFFP